MAKEQVASSRFSQAHYQKGNFLVKEKRLEPAVQAYQLTLQNEPAMEAAHYNLAKVYLRLGKNAPQQKAMAAKRLKTAEQLKAQAKEVAEKRDIVNRSLL